MPSLGRNIAGELAAEFCIANTAATAAGAGDNTEIVGSTIDLSLLDTRYGSMAFVLAAKGVLDEDETLVLKNTSVEDSADGSAWAEMDDGDRGTVLTLTGGAGGSTEFGTAIVGVDLSKARQFVRLKVTPDLSRGATDTATVAGVAVFGYAQER